MLSTLWAALVLLAAALGLWNGLLDGGATVNAMAESLFASAKTAVELAAGLVGALVLWLGIFEVAQAAGAVQWLARLLSPLLCRLMPDVPRDHPALASIGINVAMSMLGVDDGALPSGLKAMEELESLKGKSDTMGNGIASRSQQMFLVYMTTSVTLFPISILSYRMQSGSAHPADVFVPLLLASYAGLFAGLVYMAVALKIRLWEPVLIGTSMVLVGVLASLAWLMAHLHGSAILQTVTLLGNASLLAAVVSFVALAAWRRVPVYDTFLQGASKGFAFGVALIPYLVGMLMAIGLLHASGAFGLLQQGLGWLASLSGMDARWIDAVPQGIMKSFSGGGARALMLDTFKVSGPDSFAGHLSSIVQGASDTTFYILAACAAAAKLKNLGHAVIGSLVADGVSFCAAIALAQWFFG
jgi:spore maturation protein SpmA